MISIYIFVITVCFLSSSYAVKVCDDDSWLALTVCSNNYNNMTKGHPDNYQTLCQAAIEYLACMQKNYDCVMELKLDSIMKTTKESVTRDCVSNEPSGAMRCGHFIVCILSCLFIIYQTRTTQN